MRNIISLLALLLFFTSAGSQQPNSSNVIKKNATVFFLNGIGKSSAGDVIIDRLRIENGLKTFCPAFTGGNVEIILNLTNEGLPTGILRDIFDDLAFQKSLESAKAYPRLFNDLVLHNYGYSTNLTDSEKTELSQRIQDQNVASQISSNNLAKRSLFLNQVQPRISRSNSALVVAHSQGNLYANQLDEDLLNSGNIFVRGGFFVVGVATPSAFTSHNNYYTAQQDLVIAAARRFFVPPALPANVDLPGALSKDISGHNFANVYMSRSLPAGASPLSSSQARIIRTNVNFGFRQIYRPVDENGLPGVADSTSNSPCDR